MAVVLLSITLLMFVVQKLRAGKQQRCPHFRAKAATRVARCLLQTIFFVFCIPLHSCALVAILLLACTLCSLRGSFVRWGELRITTKGLKYLLSTTVCRCCLCFLFVIAAPITALLLDDYFYLVVKTCRASVVVVLSRLYPCLRGSPRRVAFGRYYIRVFLKWS